jgi:hypothetical protein
MRNILTKSGDEIDRKSVFMGVVFVRIIAGRGVGREDVCAC